MKFTIHHFSDLESTNQTAKEYVLDPEAEGTVIIAGQQTAGYGRQSRAWHSPLGNFYCSVILKPSTKPISNYYQLAFVSALAAQKALVEIMPDTAVTLKWPNDIIVDGKKLGGILIEIEEDAVIMGIGINITEHPTDASYPATSLKEHMASLPQTEDLLKSFLKALWAVYTQWQEQGFEPVREEWLKHAYNLNQPIEREGIKGSFTGLSEEGALLITDDVGQTHKIINAA